MAYNKWRQASRFRSERNRDSAREVSSGVSYYPEIRNYIRRPEDKFSGAGLAFTECQNNGHVFVYSNEPVSGLVKLDDKLYLPELLAAENSIIERLGTLIATPKANTIVVPPPLGLSDIQTQAYNMALTSPVSIITGEPGTGKTTVSAAILIAASKMGLDPAAMAPTGKAASRMAEALEGYLKPSTMHRGLAWKATDEDESGDDGFAGGPRYNRKNPLPYKFLLLDELSMCDLALMAYVLDAIANDARVVFVGDPDQLAPVGPGQPFQDFIQSGVFDIVRLNKIWRQAEGSSIAFACRAIKAGNPNDFFNLVDESKEIILDDRPNTHHSILNVARNSSPELQVLTPKRDTSAILNRNLADILNPASLGEGAQRLAPKFPVAFDLEAKKGDKILQIKNNYFKQVFNGDQGVAIDCGILNVIIHRVKRGRKVLTYSTWPLEGGDPGEKQFGSSMQFAEANLPYIEEESANEIALAYALTVHRAQGSEWREVAIDFHPSAGNFFSRRLAYTGLSRAKKFLYLAGTPEYIAKAIMTNRDDRRRSSLAERLKNWNSLKEN